MNIVVAAFAYNERPYIPYMVEYYRSQGCTPLILDNYSTDGTYEWLVENGVHTNRVDTKNSFHLATLQEALLKELSLIRPDWVVYTGIDAYYYFEGTIQQEIEKAKTLGRNVIEVYNCSVYNTGEVRALPFQSTYFYMTVHRRKLQMIAEYKAPFCLIGDTIKIPRTNIHATEGIFVNYGMCKSKEEREETFARRKRAWELGTSKGHGTHYAPAQERQWIWSKEELTDVRTTKFNKLIYK